MEYVACGSAFERPRIYRTSMYVTIYAQVPYMYSRNQKNVTFTVPALPFFETETV